MIYLMIPFVIAILVMGGIIFYLIRHEDEEKKELRDRLMARDFPEYNYYTKELPELQRERSLEFNQKLKNQKKEKPLTKDEEFNKRIREKF